ncbi:MAG: ankyrin repeat domain-containing protein [Myxococcaceae bacterium]
MHQKDPLFDRSMLPQIRPRPLPYSSSPQTPAPELFVAVPEERPPPIAKFLVDELFDPIRTPKDQIRSSVENQLFRLAGEGAFLKQEHIREFQELVSAVPDRDGFAQRLKRLVNSDRKSLLLETLSKLKPECLSEELETCLKKTKDSNRIAVLLRLGANPNIYIDGCCVPDLAIKENNESLMLTWAHCPTLIIDLYYGRYWSPLIAMSSFCDFQETMRCLISKGANINIVGKSGLTPLMAAAAHRKTQNLSILLQAGANIFATDHNNQTAWDLADETGKKLISYALQKKFEANSLYNLHTKANPKKMTLYAKVPTEPIESSFREALNLSGSGLRIYIMSHFESLGLSDYREDLGNLLNNVETRNSYLKSLPKNPAEREKFYDTMKYNLEHIAVLLSDPTIPESEKKTALAILAEAGEWCAARYMQDTIAAQRILGRTPEVQDDENRPIFDALSRLRNKNFYESSEKFLRSHHSANAYNALMSKFGVSLGLAQTNESYIDDPYAPAIDVGMLTSEFYRRYTPEAMKRAIHEAIENQEIVPALLPSLLSQLRPQSGPYADESEFMNLVLKLDGSVTDDGIFYLFLAMGILIPRNPAEHPWVKRYGLLIPEPPKLLKSLIEQNSLLIMRKKTEVEIQDLALWLKQNDAPMTMTDYWAAAISLQSVTLKNRKSYVQALTGLEFSAKIGRILSQEQVDRMLNALDSCTEEEEILSTLNPALLQQNNI